MGKIISSLRAIPLIAWLIIVALVVVGGYVANLQRELRAAERARVEMGLTIDSLEAERDTLRNITQVLEEQLDTEFTMRHFFERRYMQLEIQRDSIDRALKKESLVRAQLEASIVNLQTVIEGITQQDGEDRIASFHQYLEPYTVDMSVRLPPPPAMGTAEVAVAVDPIQAGVRVMCGAKNSQTGIRPASVLWEGPSWLTLDSLDVTQDPEVCNQGEKEISFWQSWKSGVLGTLTILGTVLIII